MIFSVELNFPVLLKEVKDFTENFKFYAAQKQHKIERLKLSGKGNRCG